MVVCVPKFGRMDPKPRFNYGAVHPVTKVITKHLEFVISFTKLLGYRVVSVKDTFECLS